MPAALPIGQALVQYKENGEVKYYVVKEFKKHEKVTGYNWTTYK